MFLSKERLRHPRTERDAEDLREHPARVRRRFVPPFLVVPGVKIYPDNSSVRAVIIPIEPVRVPPPGVGESLQGRQEAAEDRDRAFVHGEIDKVLPRLTW